MYTHSKGWDRRMALEIPLMVWVCSQHLIISGIHCTTHEVSDDVLLSRAFAKHWLCSVARVYITVCRIRIPDIPTDRPTLVQGPTTQDVSPSHGPESFRLPFETTEDKWWGVWQGWDRMKRRRPEFRPDVENAEVRFWISKGLTKAESSF